ncbi:hypothetical protein [Anaeroselena agilis]|uniref:Uncharacterized protein n=1 Tax=Anaeroselena agilis TaxID=3063788 RepID=A0ABU3NW70_9FIRM|nr:hypothetical protein [Selenomonadales bacterium 4137-cl]
MRKIDSVAAAFAELNHKIVTDILARGYSPSDAETLATVRENLKVLKDFAIDEPAAPAAASAKTKAGG